MTRRAVRELATAVGGHGARPPLFRSKHRPRERLLSQGAAALGAAELMAALWGNANAPRSSIDVAQRVLASHEGLSDLSRADPLEMMATGLSRSQAAQLAAAFELGRRSASAGAASGRWVIRTPRDVAEPLLTEMAPLAREELRVLLLNTKNVVLRQVTVYIGNVSSALVRVAELFRDAVRVNASGVIVVHNHPSTDPEPSPDDLQLTAEAVAAGRLLDITVLDHVILAGSAYVSLRDRGIAFDRR